MKEQFVTYKIALNLKELGFDEECLAFFLMMNDLRIKEYKESGNKNSAFYNNTVCSAPLWQQVIDWFREKQDIHIVITPYNDEEVNQILYDFTIFEKDWNDISDYTYYHSFQEAREQAILKAIELCQK